MSSAAESPAPRRGLGRGLEVLVGGAAAGGSELLHLPIDAIHPNPRQPRRRFEPEATSGPRRLAPPSGSPAADRRPPAPRGRLRARRRRATLARRPRGRPGDAARTRPRDRRPGHAPARARRERRPREPLAGRGGPRLRDAPRRVRALPRRGGRAGRQVEAWRLQQAAAARASRGGALDARPGRAHRGPCPGGAGAPR